MTELKRGLLCERFDAGIGSVCFRSRLFCFISVLENDGITRLFIALEAKKWHIYDDIRYGYLNEKQAILFRKINGRVVCVEKEFCNATRV